MDSTATSAVSEAAVMYLVVTLVSTSLAKMKNWRATSTGLLRETVVPVPAAPAIVIAVAAVELVLATLLVAGAFPVFAGSATAALFVCFACYRLLVARRTNALMCSCAGRTRTDPATPAAMVGTTLACLTQAGLAAGLLALGGRPAGAAFTVLSVAAWLTSFLFLAVGARRTVTDRDRARYPEQFTSLAWFGNQAKPRTTR